jgi:hypothetical protein
VKRTHLLIATAAILIYSFVFAGDPSEFVAAAAKSAEKFGTDAGGQYGVAFMRSAGPVLVPAAQACAGGDFPIGSTYDVVFIVSASGNVERMIPGHTSAFGTCISSHLRELHSAAKPSSGPWPIHFGFYTVTKILADPSPNLW